MKIHDLKIDPKPFADLVSGAKTCEIRNDDRGFEAGDMVRFPGGYTRTISHIQRGYGLPDGLCVLSYSKASAAPEQEPEKEFGEVEIFMDGGIKRFRFDEYCHAYSFPVGTHYLYTRPSAEIERLRAELEYRFTVEEHERLVAKGQELNSAYISKLEQKLAEAQALLRDLAGSRFWGSQLVEVKESLNDRIDAFLSATAQPAEGLSAEQIEDDNREWQSRNDAERAAYFDDAEVKS